MRAYKNQRISMQSQEEESKVGVYVPESNFLNKKLKVSIDDPLEQFWPNHPKMKLKPKPTYELLCQDKHFINVVTGSGAILSSCDHFGHIKCLHKYLDEQEVQQYGIQQKQVSGFITGEFTCPICKSLKNGIMPNQGIIKHLQSSQNTVSKTASLTNIVDFLSILLLKQ